MLPVYIGTCPDEGCKSVMFFPSRDKVVECRGCGQRHSGYDVKDLRAMRDLALGVKTVLRCIFMATNGSVKRTSDNIKVNGLSHFHCKLLSPLLNTYGMDKVTNQAKLLSELTNMSTLDCSVLSDRCFLIDPQHLDIPGYGRDNSGSNEYLVETLKIINEANENKEVLVPLHSDADGHCLVHAISRAVTGRELFWFPLRSHLKRHLIENLDKYKLTFKEFINASEWDLIIEECDPSYMPEDERNETIGLRNMHVFGLANVLRRPIILLDSIDGMNCVGDYSAVFLPALENPEDCRSKTGVVNPPLCLAWSSNARNHFIPLVGIKGEKVPVIPRAALPNVWGVSKEDLSKFIEFDADDCVVIGGTRTIQESYIKKLTDAMDNLFLLKYGVHPSVVCDNYVSNYKMSAHSPKMMSFFTSETQRIVQERRLYRCLSCFGMCLSPLSSEWLRPGKNGLLYNLALQQHGQLEENKIYYFPSHEVSCMYDAKKDILVLHKQSALEKCFFCLDPKLRLVYADGSIAYENGDTVNSRSLSEHCQCGFKHWWAGNVYDNPPDMVPIVMKWHGREVTEDVPWFQYETDPTLNSNAYQVASYAVHKHFPGEFGIEQLVQKVVTQILDFSKGLEAVKRTASGTITPAPPLKVCRLDEEACVTSHVAQENDEPSVSTSSEGPVAVRLKGKKEQSKKMAVMIVKESQSPKDSSTDKLHVSPPNDSEKTKEEEAAMQFETTKEEEAAMHSEKTKEEEAAIQFETTKEEEAAMQFEKTEEEEAAMHIEKTKEEEAAMHSEKTKEEEAAMHIEETVEEEAAMHIEKTKEEEAAMHIGKTEEEEIAMLKKVQTDLEEQQLQYKLRKDLEFQIELKKRAIQFALQAQYYKVSEEYDPSINDEWGYGHYTAPFLQPPKDSGRGKDQMVFEPMEEDIFVSEILATSTPRPFTFGASTSKGESDPFGASTSKEESYPFIASTSQEESDPFGASTSKEESFQFPVDMSKQSSTVRMGPGYSVLALPQHLEPDMNTVQNLWPQKTDGLDTTKRLSTFPDVTAVNSESESSGSSGGEK